MAFGDCDCCKKIFFSGILKEKQALVIYDPERVFPYKWN